MKILAAATFIVSLAFPSFAQRNTATVFGTVTDSSGGFITAARIRIANDDTGQESATVSDAVGNFILPDLAPGRYSLTAAMPRRSGSPMPISITLSTPAIMSK